MKSQFAHIVRVVWLAIALGLASVFVPQAVMARACVLGSSAACPIRISLARGTYGTTVHGRLTQVPQQKFYAFRARAGQSLTIAFAGAGAMRGGINFPGGSGDGPFNGDGVTIALPTSGDYIIYLGQNTMAGEIWTGGYSLGVMVR